MKVIRRLALVLALLVPTTSAVLVTTAAPALAHHGGEVGYCGTNDYFSHNEWWQQSPGVWWRNVRVDRWEWCENGAWYYEGQYSQGWYNCYCYPEWYATPYDVYY